MAEKPISWFVVCLLWVGSAWGFSTVPQVDCPTQFRATASQIVDSSPSVSGLQRMKATFKVDEVIKGSPGEEVEVELLKYGPLNVQVGERYVVQLSHGNVCWLEAL